MKMRFKSINALGYDAMNSFKVSLLLALLVLISGCVSSVIDTETSKCIGEKSTLYVKEGCLACGAQKELFGENLKYLNIVNCAEEPGMCLEADIIKVPTWYFGDNKIEGVLSAKQLKEITGC